MRLLLNSNVLRRCVTSIRGILGATSVGVLMLIPPACVAPTGQHETPQSAGERGISEPQTFATPDALRGWSFSNGPEWPGARGAMEHRDHGGRPDREQPSDGVLVLEYDFRDGGNYVAAIAELPTDRQVEAVRLWVHKPASNLMIFRAADSAGETFQKNFQFHYAGWQQLEIALDGWIHQWGGDGVFQQPARRFDILIENDGGNRVGELLIDDVQWVYDRSADASPSLRSATYLESDFRNDGWSYSGPPGGGFENGTLRYRFDKASDRCGAIRGRSILGRPTHMRLTVESDGSGHEVTASCGSHFQGFHRAIGRLSTVGVRTFEVPMGDMTTWDHSGGENDGIVRYPLRLESIGLTKEGGARDGSVKLLRLEFVTEYDEDESVAIEPRVEQRAGDRLVFTVPLRSLREQSLPGTLVYSLNALDDVIESGAVELVVPGGGRVVTHELITGWRGHSMIEGSFEFQSGGQWGGPVTTTIARADVGTGNTELDADSRMGVGMYLYRFQGHPQSREWMERMCRLAAAAGVKWTREEFHWNWVEPVQGQYDFRFFDELVDTATAYGISVYGLVCYWTEWTGPPMDEAFIDHYCEYVRALVGRYKDRIRHWEIWNEPNVFFWPGPKELYAKLLTRAYATIKEVDPSAQVLGCSTAGIDVGFIQMVLDQDAPFDALTVHPYRQALDADQFLDELRATRDLAGGRDVWITEMGWPSNIGGLSEREQAGYVARTYVSALASDAVRTVSWYDFREDGDDPYYNEHHFGLVRGDLTPKMGYRALAAVGQLLGSADFESDLELGDDLVAFLFRDGERRIVAIWAPDSAPLVCLDVQPDHAKIHNAMNENAKCVQEGSTVTIGLQRDLPVYIYADEPLTLNRLPAPVRVNVDQTSIHPDGSVSIHCECEPGVSIGEPTVPAGWVMSHDASWQNVHVTPAKPAPGTYSVSLPVHYGGQIFHVPIRIEVVPLLLRG